jgi:rhodanese-related sulfurtransferase
MPSQVFWAADVRRLIERGAQLVDVLPPGDFETDHIPGAVNIPLKQLNASAVANLDRSRPVIVYCDDFA